MAPNLAVAQRRMIHDMMPSNGLTAVQMAGARRQVYPLQPARFQISRSAMERLRTPSIRNTDNARALREHPLEKLDRCLDEMAVYQLDEFVTVVPPSTVSRTLRSAGWSNKACRRVARGRIAHLRDYYLYNLSSFRSYHLVYVDKSGCDKRIGFRRTRCR
jgi:hypothetical protein